MRSRLCPISLRHAANICLTIASVWTGSLGSQESYLQMQARRQQDNRKVVPLRVPDFGPFESDLAAQASRLTELDSRIADASIRQLEAMLDNGQLTSLDLVLWYVSRIRRHDVGKLRSVLELNPDALNDARILDGSRQSGKKSSRLHGIPILFKDNIATAGKLHTTAGAAALLDAVPDRDAFIVQRLRAAGAIVLGKTNLTEWANFMTERSVNGFSAVGGQTINPYGKFEVGGSSAGSAVAATCHFAAAAIGSETYGSIVYPASFNSVFGLKPTVALVSRDRIIPITEATDTAGPMTRSAADAAVVLSAIAGVDPNDWETVEAQSLKTFDFVASLTDDFLSGKRIAILNGGPAPPGDEPIRAAVATALTSAGAIVETVDFNRRKYPFGKMFTCGFKNGVDAYLRATNAPFPTLKCIAQFNVADLPARAPFGQTVLEESIAQKLTAAEYRKLIDEQRKAARDDLEAVFAKHDLILSYEYSGMHGGIFPMAGVPAFCVPAGYRESGEPVGVLFVARRFEDGKALAAGHAFSLKHPVRRQPRLSAD